MNVSDRNVDLKSFFPFTLCENDFCRKALNLGKCVKYATGESVLTSGSPAKHCGVIVEGQAVAFKFDQNGKRYQLCLDEGCFIGLETLTENNTYSAKITAVTDIEVFFWNKDGLMQLQDESFEFAEGLKMLDEGRTYQEEWLIPETEITDPVLSSRSPHWISIIFPAFIILPVLMLLLWACSLLIRRYPVAWILVFGLLISAGVLLYKQIITRSNEHLIITTKNTIHIPKSDSEEMTVFRLYRLQSIAYDQNLIERLFDAGRIKFRTDELELETPLLHAPMLTAELVKNFSERSALGRSVPLIANGNRLKEIKTVLKDEEIRPETEDENITPKFRTIEFHAHWALLVKVILKPLILFALSLAGVYYFKNVQNNEGIYKILIILAVFSLFVIIYQISSWRNHRFSIEEDCVKDYSHQPLRREDQNMAMNHKIQSVRFTKVGFFQNLLNYGTVYILAGEGELSFDYVGNPKRVQQQIKETCSLYESKRMKEEEMRRREYIDSLISELQKEKESL